MKYNSLGHSDIEVSEICLGTMTWGTQNTELEAFQQMDFALERGVNFFDTAEMYPANPISAETQGNTETIIGNWFKQSGKRDQVVLATKVSGDGLSWVQDGVEISPRKIAISIEGSLKRLQTDTIDLYQLHWPNRGSYHFRQAWRFDPTKQNREKTRDHILETLAALQRLIDQGKIRQIGLSNDSCWGISQFLQIAEANNLPRVVSTQNEYSLMCRIYDLDLAELSHNENVGLLAYSPLATGLLTGKYSSGNIPAGSRRSIGADLGNRYDESSAQVADAYVAIARKHGIDPAQMALAFCNQRPFVTSNIIGATNLEQLASNIQSTEVELSAEVLEDIFQIYRKNPVPF
ncbi:MAG: aryl-alcohol dehydrogenase-like predicted oxidoreductase [Gammaproteobacteria bacterium]|jgi:aryl-alcohol dehydrogenase-like predicted oxidoreductase